MFILTPAIIVNCMKTHVQPLCYLLPQNLLLPIIFLFFLSSTGWASETERLYVEITGVKDEIQQNVEVFLSIANAAKEQNTSILESLKIGDKEKKHDLSERTIRRLHRLAPNEIRHAMQAFGYYDPKIEIKLKKIEGIWQATYDIVPGPPTNLNRIEIEVNGDGGDEPSVKKILTRLPLVSG